MAYNPDAFERRPRGVRHLPGSAGLKREEILMAPPADPEPENDTAPVIELKPAEARRISDDRARARRAGVRKDILKRLEDATAGEGVKTDVPTGNDIASRRVRTRIAAGVKDALPTSRPLQEVPRASYYSAEADTTGYVGEPEDGKSLRVREDKDIFDPDGVLSLLAQTGAETVSIMNGAVHEPIEVFSLDEAREEEFGGHRAARRLDTDDIQMPNNVDDALEIARSPRLESPQQLRRLAHANWYHMGQAIADRAS